MIKVNHKYCLANSSVHVPLCMIHIYYSMNILCFAMLFISGRVTAQCNVYIHVINERTGHGVIWTIYPTTHVINIHILEQCM